MGVGGCVGGCVGFAGSVVDCLIQSSGGVPECPRGQEGIREIPSGVKQ